MFKPFETPLRGMTNMLQLQGSPQEAAEKLLAYAKSLEWEPGKSLYLGMISLDPDQLTELHKSPKNLDRDIRRLILANLGLSPSVDEGKFRYPYHRVGSEILFLTPRKASMKAMEIREEDAHRTCEKIISLLFKTELFAASAGQKVNEFVFGELLLSPKLESPQKKFKKKGKEKAGSPADEPPLLLTGLSPVFKMNRFGGLSVRVSSKAFSAMGSIHHYAGAGPDRPSFMSRTLSAEGGLRPLERVDARAHRAPFMRFPQYAKGETNEVIYETGAYHYNYLKDYTERLLGKAGVSFTADLFQANAIVEHTFIKNKDFPKIDELIVINITGGAVFTKPTLDLFRNAGVEELSFYDDGEDQSQRPPDSLNLDERKNYVFLQGNAQSMYYQVKGDDKRVSYGLTFFQLLSKLRGSKAVELDFYTNFKARYRMFEGGRHCFQGMTQLHPAPRITKKGEEKIGYHVLDGMFEVPKKDKAVMSILKKVVIELSIKRAVLDRRPIKIAEVPDLDFSAILIRSPEDCTEQYLEADFKVTDGFLKIVDFRVGISRGSYKDSPFIRKRSRGKREGALIDSQFYLVDPKSGLYISSFAAPEYTPTIIGNQDLPLLGLLGDNAVIGRGMDQSVLPYYIKKLGKTFRSNEVIYVDLKEGLPYIEYFVPHQENPNTELPSASLNYHIIAGYTDGRDYDGDFKDLDLLNLYFKTFTTDILKLGENSRTSIIRKMMSCVIEN